MWTPGKDGRANNCEDGHRFGKSVNTRSPLLAEEEEDRRNQGSRVTDTNPEYKVYNWPAPVNGVHVAPDTNAFPKEIRNTTTEKCDAVYRDDEGNPPVSIDVLLLRNFTNNIRDILRSFGHLRPSLPVVPDYRRYYPTGHGVLLLSSSCSHLQFWVRISNLGEVLSSWSNIQFEEHRVGARQWFEASQLGCSYR